jgi:predicted deacetylase
MQQLIDALDRLDRPIEFFVRDDDAGWNDEALGELVAIFAALDLPIDLAVIPAALDQQSAAALTALVQQNPKIGVHQHGYAHLNHEPEGARKCEFGPARPAARQLADLIAGRNRLKQMLRRINVDPIFTPPWNRCSAELASALHQHRFRMLSTDRLRDDVGPEIIQLPVMLDWERMRREDRTSAALAMEIANSHTPIGIMLHHAVRDAAGCAELNGILHHLIKSPHVQFRSMRHWIGE